MITPSLRWPARCAGLAVALLAAWGYVSTLRFDGVDGDFNSEIAYRWQPTAEDHFLAERAKQPKATPAPTPSDAPALRA